MNYRMMGKFISRILMVEAVFMIPASPFGISKLLCLLIPATRMFFLSFNCFRGSSQCLGKAKKGFYAREGLVCVGASWVVMSLLGCLPFYFSGSN